MEGFVSIGELQHAWVNGFRAGFAAGALAVVFVLVVGWLLFTPGF